MVKIAVGEPYDRAWIPIGRKWCAAIQIVQTEDQFASSGSWWPECYRRDAATDDKPAEAEQQKSNSHAPSGFRVFEFCEKAQQETDRQGLEVSQGDRHCDEQHDYADHFEPWPHDSTSISRPPGKHPDGRRLITDCTGHCGRVRDRANCGNPEAS
jgi:hypothetical protein